MITKERPIIFSGPMVRAILEGKKTQTRRVAKGLRAEVVGGLTPDGNTLLRTAVRCPYGEPGDRLWVRETWAARFEYNKYNPSEIHKRTPLWYKADEVGGRFQKEGGFGRWRPSTHMPRWTSRITLEIRTVRVERLQDISGPDCWAEGIEHAGWDCERYGSVVECYRNLWQSINGADSWDANPWVWVVEFRRVGVAV